MMDPVTAIGVAASVVTFADISWEVIKRIGEYCDSREDVPKVLRNILVQLSLLREKISELEGSNNMGTKKIKADSTLGRVIKGCCDLIQQLDALLSKMSPEKGDSSTKRKIKAVASMFYESELKKIWAELGEYMTTIMFYFTDIKESAGPSTPKGPAFLVPYDRDRKFVGRSETLAEIEKAFLTQSRVAIAGIGGVGKSQIAIEFCYRFQEKYNEASVLWVHASSKPRIEETYRDIMRKLNIPGREDPKADAIELVSSHFANMKERWLLIMDNADNNEIFFSKQSPQCRDSVHAKLDLARILPAVGKYGSILITTRDAELGQVLSSNEPPVLISPMPLAEAKQMISSKIVESPSDSDLEKLVKELNCLPLALMQAAAHISKSHLTITEYLELLGEHDEVLDREYHDLRRDSEANSVIRTWRLSFDQIRAKTPYAADILSLMAVLDRQKLPQFLFHDEKVSKIDFLDALGTLQGFSMITKDRKGAAFTMHRLVQVATQKWLESQGALQKWQEKGLQLVAEKFPSGASINWMIYTAMQPHARAVLAYSLSSEASSLLRASLLSKVSHYDHAQGWYETAEEEEKQAIAIQQDLLGQKDPKTLKSIYDLAMIYSSQARYKESEALQLQILEIQKSQNGEDHALTLWTMRVLAQLYEKQGLYVQAEKLETQVLETLRKSETKNPELIAPITQLMVTQMRQGHYKEAEASALELLTLRKEVFGEQHPSTIRTMETLATIYVQQGRGMEANTLGQQILDIRNRVYGKEHLETLGTMNDLSGVYFRQGQFKKASELQVQILAIEKRVLGESHNGTLTTMQNLITTYQASGQLKDAMTMQCQLLEKCKEAHGEEHPATLKSATALVFLYQGQGLYKEAKTLQIDTVEICKRTLPEGDVFRLRSIEILISVYMVLSEHDKAETLQLELLDTFSRLHGDCHPFTLQCKANLVTNYINRGKFSEAEPLQLELLRDSQSTLGEQPQQHPSTAISKHMLIVIYVNQEKFDEASALALDMETHIAELGDMHPEAQRVRDLKQMILNARLSQLQQRLWDDGKDLQALMDKLQIAEEGVGAGVEKPVSSDDIDPLLSAEVSRLQQRIQESEQSVESLMEKLQTTEGIGKTGAEQSITGDHLGPPLSSSSASNPMVSSTSSATPTTGGNINSNVIPRSDPLPVGWEQRATPDGKMYYVNHNTHTTTWNRPDGPIAGFQSPT